MALDKPNYINIFDSLTADRLEKYRQYKTTTFGDLETIQRYLYNIEISSEVNKAIHILEVVLRNQLSHKWNDFLGCDDWPMNKQGIPVSFKFNRMHQKIDEAISRIGGKRKNGKVIAELSFGFWVHLFDSKFDVQNIKLIQKIFPQRAQWDKALTKEIQNIRIDFQTINELRNRVAHHEPIFHQKDLDQKYDLIIKYISEINPDCLSLLQQSKFHDWRKNKWQGITFSLLTAQK
jgi:hypothetical protein